MMENRNRKADRSEEEQFSLDTLSKKEIRIIVTVVVIAAILIVLMIIMKLGLLRRLIR